MKPPEFLVEFPPPSSGQGRALGSFALGVAALGVALLLASCGGSSGGNSAPPPAITNFSAANTLITAGTSTSLIASYSGGTGSVDQGLGAFPNAQPVFVSPSWDTTYTLTVSGPGGPSVRRSVVIQAVAPPQQPVIEAPQGLLPGQSGVVATVPAQQGCLFSWTIFGGTFTSVPSGASVTFTAGATGLVSLTCTAQNAAGTYSNVGRLSIPILTTPSTPILHAPTIVTANLPGYVATAVPQAGCTLAWTISGGLFDAGSTGSSVAFTAAPGGTVTLGCRALNADGASSPQAFVSSLIAPAPLRPAITAPHVVTSAAQGLTASVAPQVGCTFSWSIVGGTLDSGQSTNLITFTAGHAGTVVLNCVAINTAGTSSPQGTAVITIVQVPDPPSISAPAFVTAGVPGYAATVFPQPGCSYTWSIAGGSITSGSSSSGITFTPGSGGGAVNLGCVVTNAAGNSAAPAAALCTIVPFPATPAISAPSSVPLGATGLVATIPAQVGCTYQWTINGGSITSGAATTNLTFSADVPGTLTLGCVAVNEAGTRSGTGMAQVGVISTPTSTITAPTVVTGGLAGYRATVPQQPGCTYAWTLTNATLTTGAGSNEITFTPAVSGTATLICVVTNALGTPSTGTATCTIAPMPVTPVVTAPANATSNLGGYAASVPAQAGCVYAWTATNGVINSGNGSPSVTFTAGSAGTLTITCVVSNAAGTAAPPGSASLVVSDPPTSVIAAPANVTANQSGYTASVAAQAGCAFAWTVTGGTLTAGSGTASITFTAGGSGTVVLTCVVTNPAGTASPTGSATCLIVAAPLVPVISAPGWATADQAGYSASVPVQTGATYAWTITGGLISGGNGTSTVTFTAGAVGTLTLSCIATNSAGTPSSAGSGSVAVIIGPVAVVTAPAYVTAGQVGYGASVPAQASSSYAWTITNGTITSATNTTSITFTAGASGTTDVSCVVTNAAGTASLPGTVSCAIVPAPPLVVVSAPPDVTANLAGYTASAPVQAGCTYAWTIGNGTLTAGNGSATITFTPGGAGTVTLSCTVTNAAGTASSAGTANCNIHPVPSAPITAPSFVTANQAGYLATVPVQGGCTYAWTAVGGTITAGANSNIVTFTAGGGATMTLNCVVTNFAGTSSTPGSSTLSIVAAPATPVITAPAFVTAIAPGYTASTPAQPGCSFAWTVVNGNLAGGNGTATITFTPATAGTVTISCTASNGAGSASAVGSATSTIVALPIVSAFTATPSTITLGNSSILTWTVANASSLTIDNGVGDVTALVSKNVSPVVNATYTLSAANQAGTVVTAQAPVIVAPSPVISSFIAAPNSITFGATTTLTGVFSGGVATVDHGIGVVTSTVSAGTPSLVITTTYTLTVTNAAGATATATATVTVSPAPAPGTYTATGPGVARRLFHTGTLLGDGTVLLAGGSTDLVNGLSSAEIYTPALGTSAATTGAMGSGRFFHTATLLPSGKVLLLGGIQAFPGAPPGAELYDPATGLFTPTLNPPLLARAYHTATLLQNGKVLIAGGTSDFSTALASAEIFDPALQTFTATGPLGAARRQASATLLLDGRVFIAGGSPNGATSLATAELYDPTLGTFTATVGNMAGARFGHSATLLPSGSVLVAGGASAFSTYLKTAEIFDSVSRTFAATSGPMNDLRYWHAAVPLAGGNVLLTGGTGIPSTTSSEMYDLPTGTFKATVPMLDGRYGHAAVPFAAGVKILLSGGQTVSGTASAEVFQ